MTTGIVQKVEGEYAIVQIKRQDMCGDCHACDVVHPAKECKIKCINLVQSKVGDVVELSLDNESFLKASYIMYGIPLIGFLGGLLIGYIVAQLIAPSYNDLIMIVGAIVGMLLAFILVKKRDKKNKYKKMLPQVISINNHTH